MVMAQLLLTWKKIQNNLSLKSNFKLESEHVKCCLNVYIYVHITVICKKMYVELII